ncbi:DUF499 domain-containing protein [Deinococcus arenicola]|uniref:DUF499 domain-containing protein n=1 Tax=Deinococcus arenicola TaxID=2994950 RepID=A0ABU4DMK4_9DEIO|nr:DUF499 domain-containing protein [Deinococcus sp. ZS9-10]MDV6373666.1 DUF499 domain-containing protein [Deinococcus sp. ZS9-10]
MALSNRQRVQGAQDALLDELVVYVERALRGAYGEDWVNRVTARFAGTPIDGVDKPQWDMQLAVKVMAEFWHDAFGDKLKQTDRNNIFELRDWRNALAHDQPFTYDDTHRALDTMHRVASRIGLGVAAQLMKERDETMRIKLREQERSVSRSVTHVDGKIPEGLKAWRDVIIPHADVREGKFLAAEFAADLAQVYKGDASAEYGEPRAFFNRTFVTAGLRDLLTNALTRLGKGEGDPVVELQTNFGGGKTHSMLALYHLFGNVPSQELPGLEAVHAKSGVPTAPANVNRAVLVGNSLGTGQRKQRDGTVTNTIWGELAYQLAGPQGYALVSQADEQRANPGTEKLIRLLKLASPCLILIDEWVSQLRELYNRHDLPAGSFESNVSFAQSLTEAAKSVPQALVVASLPASQTEVVGEGGSAALDALKQTFKRVQSTWLPANPEESFEIVRRRLFEPLQGDAYRQVDAVVKAFTDHYAANRTDFPVGAAEPDFGRRLKNSYPIHPSLFDALFGTWSAMERFQRTRGVLRLMALVIHRLWQDGEKSLMILPGTLPLDDVRVQAELRNYLSESWEAIMNQEVDGPSSLPVQVEAEDKSGMLGQVAAARRVTRSVFMCTAPKANTAHQGIDTRSVFLSSIQPGEQAGPFSDALRRVSQQAVYLYADASHYWFSTQPSLNRRAADLAAHLPEDEVLHDIERRLQVHTSARSRGDFAGVHVTADSGSVPDESKEPAVRLVILPPEFPHLKGSATSPATTRAHEIVTRRGNADRLGRNNVVVLAVDKARLDELFGRIKQYLAWNKIHQDADASNLTPSNKRQAESRMKEHDKGSDAQIGAAYTFLLTPYQTQDAGQGPPAILMDEERLAGDGELIERVTKKLVNSGKLTRNFGALLLNMKLQHLWANQPHLSVKQLMAYFAQYLYLDRLTNPEVLLTSLREGVAASEPYFGYADGFMDGKYSNLKFGQDATVRADDLSVVVSRAAAQAQRTAEAEEARRSSKPHDSDKTPDETDTEDGFRTDPIRPEPKPVVPPPLPQQVFAEGKLDDARMVRKFQTIYEEIIQQVIDAGGDVSVELVIRGDVRGGLNTTQQRNLSENARNLGLKLQLE